MLSRQLLMVPMILMIAAPLSAQTTITRVAQSGDTATGSSSQFPTTGNIFNGFPAAHTSGAVSFVGTTADGASSLFSGVGGALPVRLVSPNDPIPGTTSDVFLDIGTSTSIGSAGILFRGANGTTAGTTTVEGMYLVSGGTVSQIASRTTAVPGGILGNFTAFNSGQVPYVNGNTLAFRGTFATGSGIYLRYNGVLQTTADTLTAIPNGTGNFTSLATNQIVSGTNVVFRGNGSSSQQGAYFRDNSSPGNPLLRITDKTQILPGTVSTVITNVFEPSISGNDAFAIVSAGTGTVRVAKYTWNGSNTTPVFAPSVVVQFGDAVPGLAGATFTNFTGFVPSDTGNVAVIGTFNDGASRTGIFVHDGIGMQRLMDTTQTLDGKTINSFLLGPDAVAGNSVTFHVQFTDATRGIYIANFTPVPEPSLLITMCCLGVTLRRAFARRNSPLE